MSDSLRDQIAQAIAARYTSEYKYVPSTERRGRSEPVPATLAERAEQSPFVVFDDTDGGRSMRVPTCTEIAERVVAAVNAARESAQVSKVAGSGNLSGSLVAALHAELAAIHGVTPGHSLTGDYAALKPDAERLARVVEGHTSVALAHATRFVYGTGRAQITVDYEPGWGHEGVPWVVRSPHPVERHPDRDTALARAHELAQE